MYRIGTIKSTFFIDILNCFPVNSPVMPDTNKDHSDKKYTDKKHTDKKYQDRRAK